jgi:hypothetical protein
LQQKEKLLHVAIWPVGESDCKDTVGDPADKYLVDAVESSSNLELSSNKTDRAHENQNQAQVKMRARNKYLLTSRNEEDAQKEWDDEEFSGLPQQEDNDDEQGYQNHGVQYGF